MTILHGPWSYSRATACARAVYKHYVEKAPKEPRPERFMALDRTDFGSILHDGANEMLKAVIVEEKPWPDAGEVTRTLLTKVVSNKKTGEKIRPYFHLTSYADEIERRLELFRNRFRIREAEDELERDELIRQRSLGTEFALAYDSDHKVRQFYTREELEDQGVEVTEGMDTCPPDAWRGRIDYAEHSKEGRWILIQDFKNRPAIFKDAELSEDEQLSGYLDLLFHEFPQFRDYDHYYVSIYYFEFGYEQVMEISREQFEANVTRLHNRAKFKESLAEDEIGPEPGFGKCQYCNWLASCRAGSNFLREGHLAPTDPEQARKLGEWLVVTEEKVKAAKEGLKLYTAEFGAVVLDDKTSIGFSVPKEGNSYDKNRALRIVKQMIVEGHLEGHRLSDYTKVDTDALKKAAKRKAVDEALEAARIPKTDSRFGTFRSKSNEPVRAVKKGRAMVTHPEDEKKIMHRQTKGKVKGGSK